MRDYIPVFHPDYGLEERTAAAKHHMEDLYYTAHKHVNEFEKQFKERHGRKHAVMTNSGSSAILVAVSSMGWCRGTKVITPAVTFATTVSPLLQLGMEPVFVDTEEGTYNIDPMKMVDTMRRTGARVAVIPHTLGNPVDPSVWQFFDHHIEDACDALDSYVNGRICGSYGDMSCFSFYCAHHITTGNGGMVLTDNEILGRTAYKYANWGRDCWCRPGQDGLCGNRFEYEISGVPYDHKYIFSVPGYNVTPLDYCGVIGKIQLSKADGFKAIRKRNFKYINDRLEDLDDLIVRPKSVKDADVNWFGYPITLKKGARTDITRRIEANGVGTRNMFGGNITRQPMFRGYEINAPCGLEESDRVMTNTFIVGLGQSITEEEMEKITRVVRAEVIVG